MDKKVTPDFRWKQQCLASNYREIHYNIGQQKMEVNRLNPVQKATYLKKSKVGKNEECTVTVKTATDQ